MKYLLPAILFVSLSLSAQAQWADEQYKSAFEFGYDNDVTAQKDRYYTNGVGFGFTAAVFDKSPFNPRWLAKHGHSHGYHSLTFQYKVYTPDLNAEINTDRPFAATMMLGSLHQYVFNNNLSVRSELQLGIIGEATGAGKLQNGLHRIMPGAEPVLGWENQIRNDIAINYILGIDKQFYRNDFAEIIAGVTMFLGIPDTKFDAELLLRVGFLEDYFNRLNNDTKRKWQAYLFAGTKGSIVMYNGTLQGGLFNRHNPYVIEGIEPFLMQIKGGIGVAYRAISLNLSQHYLTADFNGGLPHSWGELTFVGRF